MGDPSPRIVDNKVEVRVKEIKDCNDEDENSGTSEKKACSYTRRKRRNNHASRYCRTIVVIVQG